MTGVSSVQGGVSPTGELTLPSPPALAELWLLTGTHGPEQRETAGLSREGGAAPARGATSHCVTTAGPASGPPFAALHSGRQTWV